jgi:hypothetical protein
MEMLDNPAMHVRHQTDCQPILKQGRGELRQNSHDAVVRAGQSVAVTEPARESDLDGDTFPDMVTIPARPSEANDRTVPDWEVDLIAGAGLMRAVAHW